MNPLSINPLMLLGAGAATLIIGFGGGWTTNGWRLGAEISEIKAAQSQAAAKQAEGTVTTMRADADAMHQAAGEFIAIQNTIGPKIDALKKDLKNAKPLPPGCRPDDVRVRNLNAAIDAANAVAVGQ